MNTALKADFVSVADYLEGEEVSAVRHEYVGGVVFAMAGGSRAHGLITGNIFAALHAHLRGKPCQVFSADMKVHLVVAEDEIFYYPDVMVTCDPRDTEAHFNKHPKVIVEVLSPATERFDRIEKFERYQTIESLEEYVLVAQDRLEVAVFSMRENWKRQICTKLDDVVRLPSLGFSARVSEIYQGVTL